MHSFEAELFPGQSDRSGYFFRYQQLREIAAAPTGEGFEDGDEDPSHKCYQIDRAVELVKQWVTAKTTRLISLLEESAAIGLDEIELFKGHEFFEWLLEHEELDRSHLCDYDGSAMISRVLEEELKVALRVPIGVTCWAFYANWKE